MVAKKKGGAKGKAGSKPTRSRKPKKKPAEGQAQE